GKATVSADKFKAEPTTTPGQTSINNTAGEEQSSGPGTNGDDEERTPESDATPEQSSAANASGADQTLVTESRADDMERTTEPAVTTQPQLPSSYKWKRFRSGPADDVRRF